MTAQPTSMFESAPIDSDPQPVVDGVEVPVESETTEKEMDLGDYAAEHKKAKRKIPNLEDEIIDLENQIACIRGEIAEAKYADEVKTLATKWSSLERQVSGRQVKIHELQETIALCEQKMKELLA